MKKVAIIYRMSNPGGVQSCVISLVRGLNRRGIIPDILWDEAPNWDLLKEFGVQVGYAPLTFGISSSLIDRLPHTLRYIAYWFCLIRESDLERYDFIYSFYNGIIIRQTPHVYYLSGPPLLPQLNERGQGMRQYPFRFSQWIYNKLIFKVSPVYDYHQGSRYFINSKFTASLFFEAHGVKLPVVYPPINLSNRNFRFSDLDQRDTVTFFSRIMDYKRPGMLLSLAQRQPQYRYLIMGGVTPKWEPFFQALKDKVTNLHLSNVFFIPNVTDSMARQELARTRFFIFPAINEHFGMVTPEAIASGAIPYVHDSGGQVEIVNESGLRFTDDTFLGKFDSLVSAPPKILNEYRNHLLEHVQQFSEERYINLMLSCLENLEGSKMP